MPEQKHAEKGKKPEAKKEVIELIRNIEKFKEN